ncbi:MAG TPA: hypothetical protein VNN73_07910 [Blastocatellia bacterium]|nr:hypothetical protein [Blastocatellia bacterium]
MNKSREAALTAKKRIADWLMPSIADAIFLRLFFSTLAAGALLLNDGDTGWHLVTGEGILSTFKIPYSDPYSHTMPGAPWTAHEWFAEVLFALAHRLMGLNGVVLLATATLALTFFFLYLFLLHRKVNPVVAAFFVIITSWASTLHWLARPHIFSLPLTLAFVVILELYQRDSKNYLKWLPALMLLWVNLHGGYVFGLMLMLIYTGGNLLISFSKSEKRERARASFKKLGLITLATFLATFLNPQGPAILIFPFHLVGRQFIMDNVSEWMSPNFHKQGVFAFMLLLFIATLILSRKKPDIFEASVTLLLIYMSLYSVRYVPLLAIIVAPIAASRFGPALDRLSESWSSVKIIREIRDISKAISENVTSLEMRFNHHLWVYIAVAACFIVALNGGRLGQNQLMDYKHDKDHFPVEALDFALANGISGNMFNNDGWGGYIIYKSYPRYRVFMDGRSDMYGVPLLKEYMKVATVKLDYEEVLDKYNVTWMIFNANSPVCQLLAATGKWKLIYADTTADVLVKDTPENLELIRKYSGVQFAPKEESE